MSEELRPIDHLPLELLRVRSLVDVVHTVCRHWAAHQDDTVPVHGLEALTADIADRLERLADLVDEAEIRGDANDTRSRPQPTDSLTLARLVVEYFGDDDKQLLDSDIKLRDVARAVLESHGAAAGTGGAR
jgi:hypothetical protein